MDLVISIALLLSESRWNGHGSGKFTIVENIHIQSNSFAAWVIAMYLASINDSAVAFCFELNQDTNPEYMKNMKLEMLQ